MGSLVAALGSYLDARHHGGTWLVRIEDLDHTRVIAGCAQRILDTLERFGLCWDGEVVWQSRRTERYLAAAQALHRGGLTFQCSCSRRERGASRQTPYPGTCRERPARSGPSAMRFRVPQQTICFEDRLQGSCRYSLPELGDFILVRKDGVPAYQLAVVVDDADQGITDVVRGADLLESTAWQLALHQALSRSPPRYAHLPLVVEPGATKLSKSRRSVALDPGEASASLLRALRLLGQAAPPQLAHASVGRVLEWGIAHWQPHALRGVRSVSIAAGLGPAVGFAAPMY